MKKYHFKIIKKINDLKIKKQIIVVDDFSNDGTKEVLCKNQKYIDLLLFHKIYQRCSYRTAQKYVVGKYTIIQDADLEYDPGDFQKILNCFKNNKIEVVYGSEYLEKGVTILKTLFL